MEVNATTSSTQSTMASKTLSGNFDTFLKLLTAQLQNQDPLEPMDSSQFTQQLVQYSTVEQGINTNKNLETLIALQQGGGLGSAVAYIGREVSATTPDAALKNGAAKWTYTLPREAASVSVTVTDSTGKTVYSGTGPTAAGANTLTWNGKTNGGATSPEGTYTLTIKALDSSGAALNAPMSMSGKVSGVSTNEDGTVVLDVGGLSLPLSAVKAVRDIPAAT